MRSPTAGPSNRSGRLWVVAGLLGLLPQSVNARELKVCSDCEFTTIQGAVDASAAGDTVLVGPGIYREYVELPVGRVLRSARGPLDTAIVPAPDKAGAPLVKIARGATRATKVIGFTLAHSTYIQGSAIYSVYSSPEISNNFILANLGHWGGGVEAIESRPHIHNNFFVWNTGSGVDVAGGATRIEHNLFVGNSHIYNGGGVSLTIQGTIADPDTIVGNVFASNRAETQCGGGLQVHLCRVLCRRNLFVENTAALGGGGVSVRGGESEFTRNLFIGNRANGSTCWGPEYGGGLAIAQGENDRIENNTFVDNGTIGDSLGRAGSAIHYTRTGFEEPGDDSVYVWNNIIVSNRGDVAIGRTLCTGEYFCEFDLAANTFWNNHSPSYGPDVRPGVGDTLADPGLISPALGLFGLHVDSHAIDRGKGDRRDPDGTHPDIGAYPTNQGQETNLTWGVVGNQNLVASTVRIGLEAWHGGEIRTKLQATLFSPDDEVLWNGQVDLEDDGPLALRALQLRKEIGSWSGVATLRISRAGEPSHRVPVLVVDGRVIGARAAWARIATFLEEVPEAACTPWAEGLWALEKKALE